MNEIHDFSQMGGAYDLPDKLNINLIFVHSAILHSLDLDELLKI